MSGNIIGKNFLEQIVGSYVGALIQREHLKNKRLDDIITTSGNYQQANLENSLERVHKKVASVNNTSGLNIGPDEEYGRAPRQLGVTPYPPPPSSINVTDENNQEDYASNHRPPPKPPGKKRQDSSPSGASESVRQEPHYETRNEVPTSKKGFPWLETIGGALLASSLAGNGLLVYKSLTSEPSNQPPASSTTFSPTVEYNQQPGKGTVSIGVE
jgi:hypothetical protein